jgi:hypothetical protein
MEGIKCLKFVKPLINIAEKLKQIESLKNRIGELKPGKDWDDAFFRKVKFEFTYTSNKLEGNTLTYGQTIKLLQDFIASRNTAPGEDDQSPKDTGYCITNYRV